MALLEVNNLAVEFVTPEGPVQAVSDVSFAVPQGKCFGIVGESGSGKSQTFLAMLGLIARNGRVSGSAVFDGQELVGASRDTLDQLRGNRISVVFQDSITGLTPHMRVGDQLMEVLVRHRGMSWRAAFPEAVQQLEVVQIPDAERRMRQFPHELSGGMRQRVMIALALLCRPALIIADEPTTALDVTIQASVLRAFRKLKQHTDTSIVLITHDLGVVAGICDEVAVMYAGRIVEQAPLRDLFASPRHPYTQGLLACMPDIAAPITETLQVIEGRPPDLRALPPGCAFAPRCVHGDDACRTRPQFRSVGPGHGAACHRLGASEPVA